MTESAWGPPGPGCGIYARRIPRRTTRDSACRGSGNNRVDVPSRYALSVEPDFYLFFARIDAKPAAPPGNRREPGPCYLRSARRGKRQGQQEIPRFLVCRPKKSHPHATGHPRLHSVQEITLGNEPVTPHPGAFANWVLVHFSANAILQAGPEPTLRLTSALRKHQEHALTEEMPAAGQATSSRPAAVAGYFARCRSKNVAISPKISLASGASGSKRYCACDMPS